MNFRETDIPVEIRVGSSKCYSARRSITKSDSSGEISDRRRADYRSAPRLITYGNQST